VTIVCESADYRCDEGIMQLYLVRGGRPGPVTGGAASRNPGPATPAIGEEKAAMAKLRSTNSAHFPEAASLSR